MDRVESTVDAKASGLSYSTTERNRYTYTWKTRQAWASTCRELVLKLKDDEEYRAFFKFTRR